MICRRTGTEELDDLCWNIRWTPNMTSLIGD